MRRYTNWSLILVVGLCALAALISSLWIPEVQPVLQDSDNAETFSCPSYVEEPQCREVAQLSEVNEDLAEQLMDSLNPDNDIRTLNEMEIEEFASDMNTNTSDEPSLSKVKTGGFVKLETFGEILETEGVVAIYEVIISGNLEGRILNFDEDFSTISAPNLEVYLSPRQTVQTPNQLFDETNPAVEVAVLRGNIGAQNFELQTTLDLTIYNSVVIYNEDYNLIIAVAPLVTN